MKKSDFIFVLKIFALGALLFGGSIQDQKVAPNTPHSITASDTSRSAIHPEEFYGEEESMAPPIFTLVKK